MSIFLGLLLIAQLDTFQFSEISNPQVAGDSFQITIVARDPDGGIEPYNGSVLLSTSRDNAYARYVTPTLVSLQNGVWTGNVLVTLAESLRIKCIEPQNGVTGESNIVDMLTGPPTQFLTILPGEQISPGTPEGRLPTQPHVQTAGEIFSVAVHVTDDWHNIVRSRSDSVYLSCTDSFATTPARQLFEGSISIPVIVRQAATHRIHAYPGEGSPILPDTSSQFVVAPGVYRNLLVLLPGETHLPGDVATQPWETPGKSGSAAPQFLKVPFKITVYACDAHWNRLTGTGDSVELKSDFSFDATPARIELVEPAEFSVSFNTSGKNQSIWASLFLSGQESYRSYLDIRSMGSRLEVVAPDTVRAGETAYVHVTMKDVNDEPVVAAPCRFEVIAGNGDMLDSALLSDTLGMLTARFLCTRAYGDEHDTIRISADTTVDISIFVSMPDSVLAEGQIVAFPNPFGFNLDRAEIVYYLQRSTPITATIYDTFGNDVISWYFAPGEEGALSGVNRIYWDGHNAQGRRVANGVYLIQLIGEAHTGTTFKSSYRIGVVW